MLSCLAGQSPVSRPQLGMKLFSHRHIVGIVGFCVRQACSQAKSNGVQFRRWRETLDLNAYMSRSAPAASSVLTQPEATALPKTEARSYSKRLGA